MSRVLQVVLSLHPGGTERLVLELVTRLHAEIPMAVCCLDDRGDWASELDRIGTPVVALGRAPGFHPTLGRGVARAVRAHDATVIHAHHYSPFVYSCLARVLRPSTRVIFTEHGRLGDSGPSSKRRLANRGLARVASEVCAVSEDVKRHLVGEGFSASRVRVIYNGIDAGAMPALVDRERVRAQLGASGSTLVLGTIARLDPVKDLGTLISAAALVSREHDVRVLVIGDGPERAPLQQLATRLLGAERVRFTGYLADARTQLAGCDVYVNSSITEGVSLTILEAMAAGLPVVATSVGGTPEVVNESCGRLVPLRDAGALAAAIGEVAGDAELRRRLGVTARQRVLDRFTLLRMIGQYRRVYEMLAGHG